MRPRSLTGFIIHNMYNNGNNVILSSFMTNKLRGNSVLMALVLIFVGLLIFLPGLNIERYGDDLQLVLDSPSSNPFYFFYNQHPSTWYRPLEFNFEAITQRTFGTITTMPVHIASILSHIFLAGLVYSLAIRLGFNKNQAVLGAFFFGLSQATAHPALSNDTLSQVWGTLLGFLSIWLICGPLKTPAGFLIPYLLSLLTFALSLLSKESSLAFLPIIFIFILWRATRLTANLSSQNDAPREDTTALKAIFSFKRLKEAVIKIIPYAVVAILYFIIRSWVSNMPPSFGPGRYQFHLGLNIIKNVFSLIFAALTPFSSVTAFVAIANSNFFKISAIAGITVALTALIIWGISRSQKRSRVYLLASAALLAFFPMAALNHVSELHVYNALPFIAILAGAGLGKLWETSPPFKFFVGSIEKWRVFVLILIALLFASHVYAFETKLAFMIRNGERATSLISQLKDYSVNIPAGARLFLLNPPIKKDNTTKISTSILSPYAPAEYSVFLIRGFNILESANTIEQILDRSDIEIKIIEPADLAQLTGGNLILSLDDFGRLYKINPPQ